jgi:hypothetical protein
MWRDSRESPDSPRGGLVFAARAVAPPIALDEGNGVDDVIVISGILLLIAVVFLVIGLFGPLAWVYASIAVSVLSFVFLLVGVRQRRDVVAPAAAPAPSAPRGAVPSTDEPASTDVTLVPAGGRRPAAAAGAAAATAALLEERESAAAAPARVVERARPATAPTRPARATSPAASRLRSTSTTRPRAVLPARLAEGAGGAAKKTAAKKTATKKAAAPVKSAAKKAAPAKAAAAKKAAAPAKKTTAKKAAAPAKKTAAKKTAAKKTAR